MSDLMLARPLTTEHMFSGWPGRPDNAHQLVTTSCQCSLCSKPRHRSRLRQNRSSTAEHRPELSIQSLHCELTTPRRPGPILSPPWPYTYHKGLSDGTVIRAIPYKSSDLVKCQAQGLTVHLRGPVHAYPAPLQHQSPQQALRQGECRQVAHSVTSDRSGAS